MADQQSVTIPCVNDHGDSALAEITDYWQRTGGLPPELVTGHKLIDFEHRFLVSAISGLRRLCVAPASTADCRACGPEVRERCEKQLVAMMGDLFAFILDHFKTEETVMRDSLLLMVDRDVCLAHMEDHAEIATKVQEIVMALNRQHTVSRIRELDILLSRWMTHHIALHDLMLSRWIARDDSMLKGL